MRRKHSLRRAERTGDGVYLGKRTALDPEKKKKRQTKKQEQTLFKRSVAGFGKVLII